MLMIQISKYKFKRDLSAENIFNKLKQKTKIWGDPRKQNKLGTKIFGDS